MGLSKLRFSLCLAAQISFIVLDLASNALSETVFIRRHSVSLLILYLIQDGLQLFGITVLCICAFHTNVFEAGFGGLLMDRFVLTVSLSMAYLISTALLQTYILLERWDHPLKVSWPPGISLLYMLQRCLSFVYYYFYKRASLRLSDPRYYDIEWVKHAIAHN